MLQDIVSDYASRYFRTLDRIARAIKVTTSAGATPAFDQAVQRVMHLFRETHANGGRLMFIGNGGSSTIASHMAIDYFKNGRLRAMAFNDAAFLTCLGNDLGYENVFAFQIENHSGPNDVLIAISSSGNSKNILNAVEAAKRNNTKVVTLSGFKEDNALRQLGDVNFHVPSGEYGYVELLHCSICHCILDAHMGTATD